MTKKDKLLTVNRFNMPKFAQGVDRVNNNIFDGKNSSFIDQKYVDEWWDTWMKNNGFTPSRTSVSPPSSTNRFIGQLPTLQIPASTFSGNPIASIVNIPFNLNNINTPAVSDSTTFSTSPQQVSLLNGKVQLPLTPVMDYTKPISIPPINMGTLGVVGTQKPLGIDTSVMGKPGSGLGVVDAASQIAPLTKDMVKGTTDSVKKPGFNWKAAAPAIGSGVGMIGNHVISDGFNTETGTAIASAGNMIGQAVGTANPILGGIISAGSGLLGGFWNKGFGVKENKKNIAAVEANTAAAINTGNELAQATDNQAVINASGNMVGKKNYKPGNLYEDGLFTDSGTEKGKKLLDDQNRAFAYQVQGLAMGADNADKIQGQNAQMYNTVAFGGPLDSLMYNNDNMGAIEYGLLLDYVNGKNKQADMKNKMPGIVGMPNNMFALGGDKKIVASPSSVRVQKYPTNKQIKRKFTQDDYIHAGVYPSKNGGYHILDSDYKEIPISNEEAYRRVSEHAPIQDKAKARNAWQDMFGPWYTEYALGGDVQTHGADYSIGQVYDVTEEEANRLKAMGYEYTVV